MSPGVSAVKSWNPDALRATADALDALVDELDDRMKGLLNDQDALAEQWKGNAANAAALRVVHERSLGSAIAGALLQIADAYRIGAPMAEGTRMHVRALANAAEQQSFTVHDNGIVDANEPSLAPPSAAAIRRDLRHRSSPTRTPGRRTECRSGRRTPASLGSRQRRNGSHQQRNRGVGGRHQGSNTG